MKINDLDPIPEKERAHEADQQKQNPAFSQDSTKVMEKVPALIQPGDAPDDKDTITIPAVSDKKKRNTGQDDSKKQSKGRRILKGFLKFVLGAFIVGVLCISAGTGFLIYMINTYEDAELDDLFANYKVDYTTILMSRNPKTGEYVETERLFKQENRLWISLNDIPQHVQDAVVAIEDKRFYEHQGVDIKRFTGAVLGFFLGSGDYGGSTITQQLIKNLTLDDSKSWRRKAKEFFRALYIERKYEKDTILEMYLNAVYFDSSQYGIQSAARYYFGKDASGLTVAEGACLIGITKSPAYYNPLKKPENNKKRQRDILWSMNDQGKLTDEEYKAALDEEMVFVDKSKVVTQVQSYFVDRVFSDVVSDLMAQKGYSRAEAENMMYTHGLTIYTTMDPEIQSILDEVYSNEKNFPSAKLKDGTLPQSGMIVLDQKTGEVKGIVGGRGKKTGGRIFNHATDAFRQPGSSIKPLSIYAPALEYGFITPASVCDDAPLEVDTPGVNPVKASNFRFYPVNGIGAFLGRITIERAVVKSVNTVPSRILLKMGFDTSYNFLEKKLHFSSLQKDDKNVGPLAMGGMTKGVSVLEMCSAYTAIANDGIYVSPITYTRVEANDGRILLEKKSESEIVMTEQTAYLVRELMQAAAKQTYGSSAKINNGAVPVAGKTGTTSDDYDRWFIGITPHYIGGVWFGYSEPTRLRGLSKNPALGLWGVAMKKILAAKKLNSGSFNTPSNIVQAQFCIDSGMAPGPYCNLDPRGNRIKTAAFVSGTQPTETCTMHYPVSICTASNHVAHANCPSTKIVALLDYMRIYPKAGAKVAGSGNILPRMFNGALMGSGLVYSGMIPEGMYPSVSSGTQYNVLCTAHTPPYPALYQEPVLFD